MMDDDANRLAGIEETIVELEKLLLLAFQVLRRVLANSTPLPQLVDHIEPHGTTST